MFKDLFKKKKLPKQVNFPTNYGGRWDQIPLGQGLDELIIWDTTQDSSLMIFGPGGSGKSNMMKSIIYYAQKGFDIHVIDLLEVEALNYVRIAETYTSPEDMNACIRNLRNTKFEKPQLLVCNDLISIISKWKSGKIDDLREDFLWLFENGRKNNVFVMTSSNLTPWAFKYDSITWPEEWYVFFNALVKCSLVTGLSISNRSDTEELFHVSDLYSEHDNQNTGIKGRGYIKVDNRIKAYQSFYIERGTVSL